MHKIRITIPNTKNQILYSEIHTVGNKTSYKATFTENNAHLSSSSAHMSN